MIKARLTVATTTKVVNFKQITTDKYETLQALRTVATTTKVVNFKQITTKAKSTTS